MRYKVIKNIDEVKLVYSEVDTFFEGLDYPILFILADNNGVIVIGNKDLELIEKERQAIITATISE